MFNSAPHLAIQIWAGGPAPPCRPARRTWLDHLAMPMQEWRDVYIGTSAGDDIETTYRTVVLPRFDPLREVTAHCSQVRKAAFDKAPVLFLGMFFRGLSYASEDDPHAALYIRRVLDRLLGEQPNRHAAITECRKLIAAFHPDGYARNGLTEPLQLMAKHNHEVVTRIMKFLREKPSWADKVYAPDRFEYGSTKALVRAVGLGLACVAGATAGVSLFFYALVRKRASPFASAAA